MGVDITNWRLGRHYHKTTGPSGPEATFLGWGIQWGRQNTAQHDFSPDIKKRTDWEDGLAEADKGFSDFDTWASTEWGTWWTSKPTGLQNDIHLMMKAEYLDTDDAP